MTRAERTARFWNLPPCLLKRELAERAACPHRAQAAATLERP
jgi:hypothetical protein